MPSRRLLTTIAAPALPLPTPDYQIGFFSKFNSILRLYFNQIDNVIRSLLDVNGGALINSPYGAFYSNAVQTFGAANTPTIVVLGTTQGASGMSLASNKVTVALDGIYKVDWALQFRNTDAGASAIHDATFWLRKNGVDLPNSAYYVSVNERHGGVDGMLLTFATFGLQAVAGDYIEIVAAVTNTAVGLYYEPAQVAPYAHPSVPSTYVTVTFISAV